jgi:serine protease inhibitor
MKSKVKYIPLIVFTLFFLGCKTEHDSQMKVDVRSQLKSAQMVSASNTFGLNLFMKINELAPDKNLFISPFSTLEALSMTYNGAASNTKDEMASVLGFTQYSDKEVNEYNQSLTNALLKADGKIKFEVANSIWYDQDFHVIQYFLDINHDYYDAEVTSLDFTSPDAVTTINNWVNAKTHEKIQTIIDAIPPGVVMYLINAIYFKGTWKFEFDKSKTIKTDFFHENGTSVQHDQMSMEAELNYYSSDDLQAIELPYGDGAFNFVIMLPKGDKSINEVITGLNDTEWSDIMSAMSKVKVVVRIPKFKLELYSLLNDPLKAMGMTSAFCAADFTRIDSAGGLYITRVIHKTYINLDEEGTEAAAVTAVEIGKVSYPNPDEPKYFVANRPFIYAITEKSTGAILFMGKMLDPAINMVELKKDSIKCFN